MAVREKREVIAEPATIARRLFVGETTRLGNGLFEARRPAIPHPRPGRSFLKDSPVMRWGCVLKL